MYLLTPPGVYAPQDDTEFLSEVLRGEPRISGADVLDIGTGMPTSPNLHEVAQSVTPRARIVYTDNDPIVLAHARALLRSHPEGATAYMQADVTDPATLLIHAVLRSTLDFDRPIALSLNALLHFVTDEHHNAQGDP